MATKRIALVRGRVMRLTRLDGCGRPVYGDESTVTTKGFASVSFTANIDEGTSIVVTNAAGENVINDVPIPRLSGYTLAIAFTDVDPDLFALATGQTKVLDAFGNVVGFNVDPAVDPGDSGFALEVWAGAPSAKCSDVGQGTFGYLLLPFLQGGVLGDFTVENGAVSFSLTNMTTKEGNAWGVGPYDVVVAADGTPSPLLEPITTTLALRTMMTELSPPEPMLGARPLLTSDGDPLTSIDVAVTGLDATFTATPAGEDPYWVDFGDGTWDYSQDGTAITHTYEAAGTYAVVAHRGSSSVTATASPTAA